MAYEDSTTPALWAQQSGDPQISGPNSAPSSPYDDPDLRDATYRILYNRGQGNYANDARQRIEEYLGSLSPDQLLNRATGLEQGAGGKDLSSYLQSRYSGVNSQNDVSNIQALKSFRSIMGRDPNANEYTQILPIFQQADGQKYGNAWLAQYKQQYDQNPANRVGEAGKYSPQINQTFQSMLGREATQDEINHFGSLLATGNVDAYQLQDFLRGTPEYQQGQDKTFRSGLSRELEDSDSRFFDRSKQSVISKFMQNGTYGSSALDSALTDLMGQIAEKRSGFLSNLSASQYGANKELALGNYNNAREQYFGEQAYNRGQANKQQDYYQGRSDNLTDYNRQMQDYMSYLNSNGGGKSKAPWGQVAGGLIGAGIGATFGGPAGAGAGYNIGQGTGGMFDFLNRG